MLYRSPQHISRTFCTTSIPDSHQHPRPPQGHCTLHPTHPIQMGLPQGLQHSIWSLKEKKHWQKGRTIISYFHSLSGNLLRITSRALDIILQRIRNIQANFPPRNSGAISTATSPKPQQTSPYMPPTMIWSASSTRSPSTASSTRSTP